MVLRCAVHPPWRVRAGFPTHAATNTFTFTGYAIHFFIFFLFFLQFTLPPVAMCYKVPSLFGIGGKSVLVTGGGRGIGRMIAEGFASNGCTVYIAARSKDILDEAAAEVTAAVAGTDGRCVALQANLGSREGCEALAAAIAEREPTGLNVLVNNSGTSWGEPLSRTSGRMNWGWDRVLDLNVKAPFYLTRALLPSLRRAATPDDPGRVINIGCMHTLPATRMHESAPSTHPLLDPDPFPPSLLSPFQDQRVEPRCWQFHCGRDTPRSAHACLRREQSCAALAHSQARFRARPTRHCGWHRGRGRRPRGRARDRQCDRARVCADEDVRYGVVGALQTLIRPSSDSNLIRRSSDTHPTLI